MISLILSIAILMNLFSIAVFATQETGEENRVSVGDFITFGAFNGHPLLWRIVENDGAQLKLFCAETLFSGEIDASMHEVLVRANLVGGAWEGDSNWHTSDIRTYLNSDEEIVSYKGASANELPSYSARAGFLTNFSESELDVLQEITHKSHTQSHRTLTDRDGGSRFARIEAFPNIIDFDADAYEELSYLNVTERVFLPDAKDLKEVSEALNRDYLSEFSYNDTTGTYYRPSFRNNFWLREPVIYGSAYLFWGMYFLDTTEAMDYCGYATFQRGIRPMCYIQLDSKQALSGDGTLESPYALCDEAAGTDDGIQLISRSPENGDTFTGRDLIVSMRFNHEVDAVNAGNHYGTFSITRQIEDADSWKFKTIYRLSDEGNIDTDVTIDGNTVRIDASKAQLIPGETYYIHMDAGVISFKDTDERISFGGTEWTFTYYSTSESLSGFVLGKHNNSFSNTNTGGNSGFEGISKYKISTELYKKLLSYASPLEKMKITLQLAINDWSGSCHGIASTMLLAYENKLDLSQIEDTVSFYYDMSRPCENERFLDIIQYFQLAQNVTHNEHADNSKISELLPVLLSKLNSNPVVFCYRSGESNHAILALDYTQDENGDYFVYLYDMNSWYPNTHGRLTLLQITNDFSNCYLTQPDGNILDKSDLSLIQFETIADINTVNPYAETNILGTDGAYRSFDREATETVLIEIPMSAQAYTIENAAGETIELDETGTISGTMEILDVSMFVSESTDGSNDSRWNIVVEYSDSFSLATDESATNITFFTDDCCLGLVSNDVSKATFVMNQGILIDEPETLEKYEFTTYLSHNMTSDDSARIVAASVVAEGRTVVSIGKDRITISGTKADGKKLFLIDGLDQYMLTDLNKADEIIEVLPSIAENDIRPTPVLPAKPIFTSPAPAPVEQLPEKPFIDVADDAYYEDAVIWASEAGITTGTGRATFSPDASCTRAQAVTFLWRAAGTPAPEGTKMPFTDVAPDAYYYDAVLWAVENGITIGTSRTTFSPDDICSRAQIVTFLWRAQKSPAITALNPFSDVTAGAYYYNAVLWAVNEEITMGTSSSTFNPASDCTRAQIVTFLYRCLSNR